VLNGHQQWTAMAGDGPPLFSMSAPDTAFAFAELAAKSAVGQRNDAKSLF
jgi:hypothetical protein